MFEEGPQKALEKMLEKDGRAVAPVLMVSPSVPARVKCCAKFSEFRETQHLLAGSHLEKIIEKIVSSS